MATLEEYVTVVKEYMSLKERADFIDEKMKQLKEDVAELMHEDVVNEKIIEVDGVNIQCIYQDRESQSCNYNLLLETVGQNLYSQIVSKKKSTALYIKKAPKGKKKDPDTKSKSSPLQDDKLTVPTAQITF
jgi:hypothetical protein